MKYKFSEKKIKQSLSIGASTLVLLFIFAGLNSVRAWTAPTDLPAGSNAPGPLHVGSASQTIGGALSVGGFIATGGNVLVPHGATAPTDLSLVALWTGGKIRANDFCLNSSPSNCLSSVVSLPATENVVIVSGMAVLSSSINFCHPLVGGCTSTESEPQNRLLPYFGVSTARNLRVKLLSPAPSTYGCVFSVRTSGGACENTPIVSATPAVSCTVPAGGIECTSATSGLVQGCVTVVNERSNSATSGCSNTASWSFEIVRP